MFKQTELTENYEEYQKVNIDFRTGPEYLENGSGNLGNCYLCPTASIQVGQKKQELDHLKRTVLYHRERKNTDCS